MTKLELIHARIDDAKGVQQEAGKEKKKRSKRSMGEGLKTKEKKEGKERETTRKEEGHGGRSKKIILLNLIFLVI